MDDNWKNSKALIHQAWDFPLSREEAKHRIWQLYEIELRDCRRQRRADKKAEALDADRQVVGQRSEAILEEVQCRVGILRQRMEDAATLRQHHESRLVAQNSVLRDHATKLHVQCAVLQTTNEQLWTLIEYMMALGEGADGTDFMYRLRECLQDLGQVRRLQLVGLPRPVAAEAQPSSSAIPSSQEIFAGAAPCAADSRSPVPTAAQLESTKDHSVSASTREHLRNSELQKDPAQRDGDSAEARCSPALAKLLAWCM